MIEIEIMRADDMAELLRDIGYGHLGCSRKNVPYVVPVNYAYSDPYIYIYTTEGKKVEIIRENPNVCLQVEDVADNRNWRSVIVTGEAELVADNAERDHALDLIAKINPTLTPAVSLRWMDSWVRENIEAVMKIRVTRMTGRATVGGDSTPFAPRDGGRSTIF